MKLPDVGISRTSFAEYEHNRMSPPDYRKESPVTTNKLSLTLFAYLFANYKRSHTYPPNYRKESPMTNPKLKHVDCIIRSQHLLETAVNVDGNPKLHKSITTDISLLCEIRSFLYYVIDNPTLPFAEPESKPRPAVLNPIEDEPNAAI